MNLTSLKNKFSFISRTPIYRSTKVLTVSDRKKISLLIAIQIFLGLFDLVGVAVFGVMGSLAVSGVQSQSPNSRVGQVLALMGIANLPFQKQAAILAILATSLLMARTILSVVVSRRTILFLSRRGAAISSELVARLLSESLPFIQQRTTQQTLFAVTQGVSTLTIGVLATATTMISDASLLIILTAGLFLVDPAIAISTLAVFGSVILFMYQHMHHKAKLLGAADSQLQIRSNEKVLEVLNAYRESVVRNRREYYAEQIGILRFDLAKTQAHLGFMPYVSKYVLEISVIVGSLLIAAVQFALHDAVTAVATLSIFLVAGTRISPASLRLQQALIQIKSNLGGSEPTLALIDALQNTSPAKIKNQVFTLNHERFDPTIEIDSICYTYPGSTKEALSQVSLSIPRGSIVAIVGPSGGGKTTLVDVVLGILEPSSGTISISGLTPLDAIQISPGAISYVPQDVSVIDGTIRENVSMGFPLEVATDAIVNQVVEQAGLTQLVSDLPMGLDTHVGEKGARISGGQRQRLGIARALFTNPRLLVLDEATSALDGETESKITDAILNLKGNVTVLMVAHRLSTVRNADQVIYVSDGRVQAVGSFEFVRTRVPNFEKQAKLMGL